MKPQNLPNDELFQVEQKIARRADQLSRKFGYDPTHALDHWRQAEREVWQRLGFSEHTISGTESQQLVR